jgi:ribonuclease BN (tRNA processing enzyme)
MRLTVVGCSGSVPGPESAASSYLVQAPYDGRTFSLVLDLGPGAFGQLYRHLDPAQVDAIGLTHLHPDHCLDLCAFYVAARYSPTAPWPHIPVYGPPGTGERLRRAYEVDPYSPDSEPGPGIAGHFDVRGWNSEQRVGPFWVRTVPVRHPVPAYAIRVDELNPEAGSLTFSGDTGPSLELVDLARGSDLFLVESAFLEAPDNPADLHLTPRQAAEAAVAAEVETLVLTHIPPWYDRDEVLRQARPHFPGSVQVATPGAQWTIGAQSSFDRSWTA